MKGEMIPPILPEVEQPPTQAVRVEVGNNSATYLAFKISCKQGNNYHRTNLMCKHTHCQMSK